MSTNRADQDLTLAMQHHQRGELPQAEACYRRVLQQQSNHPAALHYLGVIAHQVGQHAAALDLINKSIALDPNPARYYSNQGEVLRALGRVPEAVAALRRAVTLEPNDVDFVTNYGIALLQSAQLDDAEATLRRATTLDRARPEPWLHLSRVWQARGQLERALTDARRAAELGPRHLNAALNLTMILRDSRRAAEAEAVCRAALAWAPNAAAAHSTLGVILLSSGRFDESIPCFRRAITLSPIDVSAYSGLGAALTRIGQIDEALACFGRGLQLAPHDHATRNYLGLALLRGGRPAEARDAFRAALAARPDSAEYLNHLAAAQEETGELDDAVAALRRAVDLDPSHAMARANLGKHLALAGSMEEAIAHIRRAIELDPAEGRIGSNLLLNLHYLPDLPPGKLFQEHLDWADRHAEPLAAEIRPHDNNRDPNRQLRVGYVSADFFAHAVADFIESILAAHDRSRFEVVCFSDVVHPDAYTERLRGHANEWLDVAPLSDAQLADLVRAKQIDILVDLAGHTAGNRMPLFARKPAPVQVTYLGYPDTTGLATVDWRITDAVADPPGATEAFHTESLYRLPRTFLCFRPIADAPAIGPLPADSSPGNIVTFASLNNLSKVAADVVEAWSRVLLRVAGSRMLVKAAAFAAGHARERARSLFARHGIGEDRVELIGRVRDFRDHLAVYNRVDVALDTFPYHGTTTTCEALWQGVPVVTLAGRVHMSRVGASLLGQVGLADLVATGADEYVATAVQLARDLGRLRELRAGLRERMRRAPLLDAAGVTAELETAYRDMWRRWAAST